MKKILLVFLAFMLVGVLNAQENERNDQSIINYDCISFEQDEFVDVNVDDRLVGFIDDVNGFYDQDDSEYVFNINFNDGSVKQIKFEKDDDLVNLNSVNIFLTETEYVRVDNSNVFSLDVNLNFDQNVSKVKPESSRVVVLSDVPFLYQEKSKFVETDNTNIRTGLYYAYNEESNSLNLLNENQLKYNRSLGRSPYSGWSEVWKWRRGF